MGFLVKMPKKSVRVQMYPETEKYLEQIAKEHNCLYGNKPSIAELLAQIYSGRLIVSKANINLNHKLDNSSIAFLIEVPRYIAGTIAIVSEIIAEHKGNIRAVKNRSRDNLGILQVFLSLPPESDLSKLITELENIRIKQLFHLNETKELQTIAMEFESRLIGGRKKVVSLDNFLEQKLISNMACVMGFKLVIQDEVGTLAKVANIIAETRLLIYSISENFSDDANEAIIKLFLYLRPTAESSINKQIEKIAGVIKQLEKIEEVKDVEPLSVDSLD